MAEPGTASSPPSPGPSSDTERTDRGKPLTKQSRAQRRDTPDVGASQDNQVDANDEDDDDDERDTDEEPTAPEFVPGECLFCSQNCGSLDDNLKHMATAHGFSIPFQEFLAVDLETVVWYVHFVIYGYKECISCSLRKSTVEGVQHHMAAKGHCRFDVSEDTQEFYELPQTENVVLEQAQRDGGSMPVRLPSGRLISNRKQVEQEPRAPRRPVAAEAAPRGLDSSTSQPNSSSSSAPGNEVARRDGNGSGQVVRSSEALLAAQLSKLVVAGTRLQQKQEQRKRGRLEAAQNILMMNRFRLDAGDGRIGRQFCC